MSNKDERVLECCGFSKVTTQGQMTIPREARTAVGFGSGTRLMVFADRERRQLIVTLRPLDEELLDLGGRTAAASKKEK